MRLTNLFLAVSFYVVMWDSQRMVPTCSDEMAAAIEAGQSLNPELHCGYEMQTYTNYRKLMTRKDVNLFLGFDYWGEHPYTSPYLNLEVAEIGSDGKVINDTWGVNEELARRSQGGADGAKSTR